MAKRKFHMKQLGAAFVDEKNGIAGASLKVDPRCGVHGVHEIA